MIPEPSESDFMRDAEAEYAAYGSKIVRGRAGWIRRAVAAEAANAAWKNLTTCEGCGVLYDLAGGGGCRCDMERLRAIVSGMRSEIERLAKLDRQSADVIFGLATKAADARVECERLKTDEVKRQLDNDDEWYRVTKARLEQADVENKRFKAAFMDESMKTDECREAHLKNHGANSSANLLRHIAETGKHAGKTFGGEQVEAAAQAILNLRADRDAAVAQQATFIGALQELSRWPDLPGVPYTISIDCVFQNKVIPPELIKGIMAAILKHAENLLSYGQHAVEAKDRLRDVSTDLDRLQTNLNDIRKVVERR